MAARATITVVSAVADVGTTTEATLTSNYIEVEIVAYVDTSSDNQWFYETIPLGDVRFNSVEKNLTDITTLTDEIPLTFEKNTTETLAFAEDFARVVSYNRSFTDAFTLDDLSQVDKDFFGNKGNIFAFTDIVGLTHDKNLVDTYSVGDVFAKVVAFYRDFTESVALGDTSDFELAKTTVDSVAIDSLVDFQLTLPKEDSYTVGDVYLNNLTKNLVDAFALDDSALVDKDFFGAKGNVLSFSEVFARAVIYSRTFTDTIAFLDSLAFDSSKTLEEAVTLNELFERQLVFDRDFSDTTILGDFSSNNTNKNVDDPTNVTDVISFIQSKFLSDTYSFSDTNVRQFQKSIFDGIGLDDSALVNKNYFGNKGNIMSISDVVVVSLIVSNTINSSAFNTRSFN